MDLEEQIELRRELRNMYNEIRQDKSLQVDGLKLRKKMKAANDLLDRIRDTGSGIIDAHIFEEMANICKSQVENLNLNEEKFNSQKFAVHLANQMGIVLDDDGLAQTNDNNWIDFGNMTKHFFGRVPPLGYLFDSFDDVEKDKEIDAKVKPRRMGNKVSGAPTRISRSTSSKKDDDNVDELVRHVHQTLKTVLQQKRAKSINLYKFSIDPDSFGRSIENIFFVSFLVKERKVGVKVADDKNNIDLFLISSRHDDVEQESSGQHILTLTYEDWSEKKKALKIENSLIKPIRSGRDEQSKRRRN